MAEVKRWYHHGPQEYYLAGFAGTGKSTVAGLILNDLNVSSVTATFTGKAAHVLRRKGVAAQTIHSLIYEPVPDSNPVRFRLAEESDLWDADLLVVDEVSMVDDEIANDLRAFKKKILVLGDPGQLPPIHGAGAFTRRQPDFFLTEIHRQAAESPILRAATAAREGRPLALGTWGALTIARYSDEAALEGAAAGDQLICGVHRVRWNLTRKIRAGRGVEHSHDPVDGERVICTRNNRELGLFNGALGDVVGPAEVTHTGEQLRFRVQMEDTAFPQKLLVSRREFREHYQGKQPPERYSKQIDQFDFGMVLTAHKSQGSEWDNVIVIDDSASFREDSARWLYTAISRASKKLTLLR